MKLDTPTKGKIANALKPFKKIATPIRWVKPENWHLTIKFIGEVDAEKKGKITEILKRTRFQIQPFEIVISGFGKFGRGNDLTIFWAGIEENETLKNIYTQVEDVLEKIKISREIREFKPHLTIGRNRKPFNFKSFTSLMEKNHSQPIARFKSNGFQIYQSMLTSEGPIYTILEEITFSNA